MFHLQCIQQNRPLILTFHTCSHFQRGVEWMMCHRARDLITMEGCLDFKLLALGEWQRNEQGATMLTQVWEG